MFQAEVRNMIGRKREDVHRAACELSYIKRQVNSAILLPSPGKRKLNSGACSAMLHLIVADEGEDRWLSMQFEPY